MVRFEPRLLEEKQKCYLSRTPLYSSKMILSKHVLNIDQGRSFNLFVTPHFWMNEAECFDLSSDSSFMTSLRNVESKSDLHFYLLLRSNLAGHWTKLGMKFSYQNISFTINTWMEKLKNGNEIVKKGFIQGADKLRLSNWLLLQQIRSLNYKYFLD